MITVDLVQDWIDFVQKDMRTLALAYDSTLSAEKNTLRYLTGKRRIPPKTLRTVQEARELRIPSMLASDYNTLKNLIEQGGDLTAYLSRDVLKGEADKNDRLLNAWGIHHLHFLPGGTRDVLFVKFTDSEAFVLQTLPHGAGHPEAWVETSLLEILHNNWPQAAGKKITGIQPETLTSHERVTLRKKNANFATGMPDGTVYLGDGGLTASGHSIFDIRETDKMFADLAYLQKLVESNEANIRDALGVPLPQELSIQLVVVAGECWLYEPVTQRRLSLNDQNR